MDGGWWTRKKRRRFKISPTCNDNIKLWMIYPTLISQKSWTFAKLNYPITPESWGITISLKLKIRKSARSQTSQCFVSWTILILHNPQNTNTGNPETEISTSSSSSFRGLIFAVLKLWGSQNRPKSWHVERRRRKFHRQHNNFVISNDVIEFRHLVKKSKEHMICRVKFLARMTHQCNLTFSCTSNECTISFYMSNNVSIRRANYTKNQQISHRSKNVVEYDATWESFFLTWDPKNRWIAWWLRVRSLTSFLQNRRTFLESQHVRISE